VHARVEVRVRDGLASRHIIDIERHDLAEGSAAEGELDHKVERAAARTQARAIGRPHDHTVLRPMHQRGADDRRRVAARDIEPRNLSASQAVLRPLAARGHRTHLNQCGLVALDTALGINCWIPRELNLVAHPPVAHVHPTNPYLAGVRRALIDHHGPRGIWKPCAVWCARGRHKQPVPARCEQLRDGGLACASWGGQSAELIIRRAALRHDAKVI
jgi:hypothetical protein